MFHFDAHCDTYDEELGSKYSHGTPFRRAVEEGLIDPTRCIQVGIRGAANCDEAWSFSLSSGMRVMFMDECHRVGVDAVIAEAHRIIGDGKAYCTFDVDGLDPAYAPGTGTPEVGGFTTVEAQRILRGLRGLDLSCPNERTNDHAARPLSRWAYQGSRMAHQQHQHAAGLFYLRQCSALDC